MLSTAKKLIIGAVIAAVLIIVVLIVLFAVKREKVIIDSTNNRFTIALCGSCNGPDIKVGGDVTGSVPEGVYTVGEFVGKLTQQMNEVTMMRTGLPDEWNIELRPTGNLVILSNAKRAWTLKSQPDSVYETAGLTGTVDNFWVFWNGTVDNSKFVGTKIKTVQQNLLGF